MIQLDLQIKGERMITRKCPKCGQGYIDPKYSPKSDQLIFECSCGYSWAEDPLDKFYDVKEKE